MNNKRLQYITNRLRRLLFVAVTDRQVTIITVSTCCLILSNILIAKATPNDAKVEELVQEVFLGEIVYPQDQGELQFTTGYLLANKGNNFLWGSKGEDDFQIPVLLEYGLTDRLQLGTLIPVDFLRTGQAENEGVGNVELELYYNFYNDRRSGRAYGVGFALGLPPATSEIGENALSYEPFFVAYQQFNQYALNFSASLEIEEPLGKDQDRDSDIGGDLSLAVIRKYDTVTLLAEIETEIESDNTLLRLAPGLYWQPRDNFELGVSLPIGLTNDTPDLGVFVLMTIEFGGSGEK